MIHPSALAQSNSLEMKVRSFSLKVLEIRTEIELKRAKFAMGLNLRGEVAETRLIAATVFTSHKLVLKRAEIETDDLPQKPKGTNPIWIFTLPVSANQELAS